MTDDLGGVWKINDDGYRCKVLPEEYRNIFLMRRKKITYKTIGNIYQVNHNHARQIFFKYLRRRKVRVFWYLKDRNNRGKHEHDLRHSEQV